MQEPFNLANDYAEACNEFTVRHFHNVAPRKHSYLYGCWSGGGKPFATLSVCDMNSNFIIIHLVDPWYELQFLLLLLYCYCYLLFVFICSALFPVKGCCHVPVLNKTCFAEHHYCELTAAVYKTNISVPILFNNVGPSCKQLFVLFFAKLW